MVTAVISDIGKVRKRNEDSYLVEEERGLFLVCDGMGGHRGGDVASNTAVQVIGSYIKDHPQLEPDQALQKAISRANLVIHNRGEGDPNLHEMGTTVTAAYIRDNHIHVAHVGDSSLLLIRGNTIEKITRDHTLAQHMVGEGLLSPAEVRESSYNHILTRSLGTSIDVDIDSMRIEARVDDILLLSSDGLTDMLEEEEIHILIQQHRDNLPAAARALLDAALVRGGYDNITLILVWLD